MNGMLEVCNRVAGFLMRIFFLSVGDTTIVQTYYTILQTNLLTGIMPIDI